MFNNKNNFISNGEGYLYSVWSGELKEQKGKIVTEEHLYYSYFLVTDLSGRVTKKISCSDEPGIVYNKMVWLKESDRTKASSILIEYEKNRIAKLEEDILRHKEIIKILETK